MRYLFLLSLLLCFAAVLTVGFLNLMRELLTRNFFGEPSLPSVPPEQIQSLEQDTESHYPAGPPSAL